VPKNVKLEKPLQSYFRINSEQMGQFERTLIICEEDTDLHYIEGCTAPKYSHDSLHAAVVEIFVHKTLSVVTLLFKTGQITF
jgi:ABC-type transport system involved in Fe-S cluster assembly, permease component